MASNAEVRPSSAAGELPIASPTGVLSRRIFAELFTTGGGLLAAHPELAGGRQRNAEVVAEIATMARRCGREMATPSEVRALLAWAPADCARGGHRVARLNRTRARARGAEAFRGEAMGVNDPRPWTPAASPQLIRGAVEVAVRLGAIALMVGWCLLIIAPFLGIVAWALIIAIAMDEPFEALCRAMGGRRVLAAVLCVAVALCLIFGPAVLLSESLITAAQQLAHDLKGRDLSIPPPRPEVRELPILGPVLYEAWQGASENLVETLGRLRPQLQTLSGWLLRTAGSVGAGILELIASIVIAGVMLVRSELRRSALARFADRMAGPVRGPALAALATATVRSVVQGILGVAAFQSFLAGGAFVVAGIPAAGLWALLVLVAAVVQIPVALAMVIPVAIGFSTLDGAGAIALLLWCMAVGLVDNVLKPILFGRGVKVPTLVIFMGALGGMLTMGIIGLFLGAVVLALGFELFMAWLLDLEGESAAAGPVDSAGPAAA